MKKFTFLTALLGLFGTKAQADFMQLFGGDTKPLIAAIMVNADEKEAGAKDKAVKWTLEQLKIAEDNGMQGFLVEFRGGEILTPKITKEKYQLMVDILKDVIAHSKKAVIGVEILWHYPEESLKLAKDAGAKFVRTDFFSDHVLADGKPVPINPEALLKYKKKIGAQDIILLTDVQVKYSEMVDKKITIKESTETAIKKGSQGIIVTSDKSGTPPSVERVSLARQGLSKGVPLVIGSGFNKDVAKDLIPLVDAIIVGTSISVKTGGPLIPEKVKELVETVAKLKAGTTSTTK
jgi:predicted TIM-barrel enzyme